MSTPTNKLTDKGVRNAKPGPKPVKMFDGEGLFLLVQAGDEKDSKRWRFKYRFGGKEKLLALGTFPAVSLKEARERRQTARDLLTKGIDPGEARKAEKSSRSSQCDGTFEAVAREWHKVIHAVKTSEGHAARTLIRLEQDAFPYIGSLPLAEITPPKLLDMLRRVEARGAIETAHRVKQACGQVFRYGVSTGRCERDPSADLKEALQPVIVKHHAAITDPSAVGGLLRAIHGYQGHPVTRAALKLAPLVFLRPGELRHAEWAEIDLDAALWTIPASRMKRTKQQKLSSAPHLVPLSSQAVAVLRDLQPLTGSGNYVFPSPRTSQRPMSENGVLSALRRMGFEKEEASGHGFRATARTLMAERLGIDDNIIEAQLAHAVKDSLGRAYNRTEYVEQRRVMMQSRADYLDKLRHGAEVIPFKAA
ncbi:MAG TPA: integrase arm-type DNA-binding domain-containing protein [Aquabacterium sp.]|nr:integrase arm-type DNA-binding domain-containing protein [Aquabacterium sp.]